MPQQLIYTSAFRGLVAGRSGQCTVARSEGMREALMLPLEKWSYYEHHSLNGGVERPIYCYRILDFRGSTYYVLSKIQDSGLNFAGQTNFIAPHLVFSPEEIRQFPSPPIILRDWKGWVTSWSREPQLLEYEDWLDLPTIHGSVSIPPHKWQELTGDAVNGYGLLEARAGIAFRVDGLREYEILTLFAESLALLEHRDPRGDFRATAWQYTFTTSMQEPDNPSDFRWCCLFSDNPGSSRFVGINTKKLTDVRPVRVSNEEGFFARLVPQPPEFVKQPQNVTLTLGQATTLHAEAKGVPAPQYQWFSEAKNGKRQEIRDATGPEFFVHYPPLGTSRYLVRASNCHGEVNSQIATLHVEHRRQKKPVEQERWLRPPRMDVDDPISGKAQSSNPKPQKLALPKQSTSGLGSFPTHHENVVRIKIGIVFGVCWVVLVLVLSFFRQFFEDPKRSDSPPPIAELGGGETDPSQTSKTVTRVTPTVAPSRTPTSTPEPEAQAPLSIDPSFPYHWKRIAIGDVSNVKTKAFEVDSGRVFNLSAQAEGFGMTKDNVFFVCREISAGFLLKATLSRDTTKPVPTKGLYGVMVRESVKPNAAFCFIGASPSHIVAYCRDGGGDFISNQIAVPSRYLNKPVSFIIQRRDNVTAMAYSFDGETNLSIPLSSGVSRVSPRLIGLAIASGDSATPAAAQFFLRGSIYDPSPIE